MNCSVVFFLLALTGLALFGYRRLARHVSALRARLEDMELELARLRSRLEQKPLTETAPAVGEAATELEPAPTEPVEVTTPSPPAEPEPEPVAPAATTGAPAEAGRAAAERAEEPPPSPPPSAPPLEPAPPSRPPIDLEQWIGVRGAAVLGGVVLAIAGFFFLRYSIEAGWLKPAVRVVLGVLAGLGSLAGAQVLRRRDYDAAANALSGAGIVLLYAATWAARVLYGFIGYAPAFVLMALVTVTCGVLSWRYRSLVVALLGLLGGFATPLLLTSGRDNPLGLFGYLLLLNAGVAFLRRRIGWPWLSLLAFLASLFFQAIWIVGRMGPERIALGLIVLGAFAAFFAFGAETLARARGGEGLPFLTQAGAVMTPFLFALYFASSAHLDVSLWALLALLAPLAAATAALSRVHRQPSLEIGAAAAELGVLVAATTRGQGSSAFTLSLLGSALVLGAVHLGFAERDRRRESAVALLPTLLLASGALLLSALAMAADAGTSEAGWLAVRLGGWLLLFALLLRLAHLTRHWLPDASGGLALGLSLATALGVAEGEGNKTTASLAVLVTALLVALGLQLRASWLDRLAASDVATWRRLHRASEAGLALAAALPLSVVIASSGLRAQGALVSHLGALLLALCIVLAAIRSGATSLLFAPLLLSLLVHTAWSLDAPSGSSELFALVLQLLSMILLASLPLLVRRTADRAPVWICAALYPALWLIPSMPLWRELVGSDGLKMSVMPLILAALSLVPLALAARRYQGRPRTSSLAWLASVALGLVALAIPIALEREWLTVAWALQAVAVILLWRRLDHPGLKVFATLLFAIVFVRLSPFNLGFLLEYPGAQRFAAFDLPVLNWLLYTYGVPIAALLLSARWLLPIEVARARRWEALLYRSERPFYALSYGAGAILLIFFWLNLTIYEAFSPRGRIAIVFDHDPARDLTLSLGWGIYALLLLALGVWRRSTALRWISLGFLLLTFAKAFLYDLRQLAGLYRVGSLMALAVSLIAVSLLYQRFVFRRGDEDQD